MSLLSKYPGFMKRGARRLTICPLLLLCALLTPGMALGELPPLERAMEELDREALDPAEGIWEYPLDEVAVLVRKSRAKKGEYVMTVLEAFDTRLNSGDTIGILLKTAEPKKFLLRQYTERKGKLLSGLKNFHVTLSDNGRALLITSVPKLSVRINPWRLLPRFLQVVRTSVPTQKAPAEGLRRIYPSIDGPGLFEEEIVIL